MKHKTLGSVLLPALLAAVSTHAQTIKENNATELNSGASWVGGVLPSTTGTALINSTLADFSALSVTNNFSVRTLALTDPANDITITVSNSRTFSLGDTAATNGSKWIDMSATTRDLTITRLGTGAFRLLSENNQVNVLTFDVASGRTLTIDAPITTISGRKSLGINNSGTVAINGAVTATAGNLGLQMGNGILALNGANQWNASSSSATSFREYFEINGGTLRLGNDSALVNIATGFANPFKFKGGTVEATGADRVITTTGTLAHGYQIGGNFAVGGNFSLTLTGGTVTNVTNANNTLTNNITTSGKSLTIASDVALSNDATDRTLTIDGAGNTLISGAISNGGTSIAGALTKNGNGTLTLGNSANAFGGPLTINAGTVALGGAGVLPDAAQLVLNGGSLDLNGFDEAIGSLTVSSNSVLDIGSNSVSFLDSSANAWNGTLSIIGTYTETSIRFGSGISALLEAQLAAITVNGVGGYTLDNGGYLVASAIPEPSSFAALAGLLVIGFTSTRRRRS